MEKQKNKKGFTLVELIIVITILSILATIAFISFSGYSKNARDGNRISTLGNMQKGLVVTYAKTGKYPMPEGNYISILSGTGVLGYQGYFGENISRITQFSSTPLDPFDNNYYTYSTNLNQNKFQLLGFFENNDIYALKNFEIEKTYALDYSNRVPKVFGDNLGIIVGSSGSNLNMPLQSFYNPTSFTGIDVLSYTGTIGGNNFGALTAYIDNSTAVTGTGNELLKLDSMYKGVIQTVMISASGSSSCPSSWNDIGEIKSGSNVIKLGTTFNRACEKSSLTIPKGTIIAIDSCPSGFNDIGPLLSGITTVRIAGIPSRSCEAINDISFPQGSIFAMLSCPSGFTDLGEVKSGTTIVRYNSLYVRSCQKN